VAGCPSRAIVDLLLGLAGPDLTPDGTVRFTGDAEIDQPLNDLEHRPHLFLLGSIAQFLAGAGRAWRAPIELAKRLGGDSFATMSGWSAAEIEGALASQPPSRPALHSYPAKLAGRYHAAMQRVVAEYGGHTARIWLGSPPAAKVIYRLLLFDGVGLKIATMATNILARDFGLPFSHRSGIDISVDAHVTRVFARLGLVRTDASDEQITYRARSLHPEYPGIFDLPVWRIGTTVCKAKAPNCAECPLIGECPTAGAHCPS
jgi:endonuclease III